MTWQLSRYLMSGVFRIFLILHAEGLVFFGKYNFDHNLNWKSLTSSWFYVHKQLQQHQSMKTQSIIEHPLRGQSIRGRQEPLLRHFLCKQGDLNGSNQTRPNLQLFNQLFWVSFWFLVFGGGSLYWISVHVESRPFLNKCRPQRQISSLIPPSP